MGMPILSLGVYIFSQGFRNEDGRYVRLFSGESQEDRYSKILQSVVENVPAEILKEVGGNATDIGTHSTRKGAASYVLSQLGGPNVIVVFLRCCWSLGNVQDRYIFLDAGGDQFVGRSVGGLPTSDPKFATLPPHLSPEDSEEIRQLGWGNLLPGYEKYPTSFQTIVPYPFACIVFHVEYIEKEFDSEHPIFQTRIFTGGYVDRYRGKILLGIGSCPATGMVATGVPRDISVLHKLSQQDEKFSSIETRLDRIENILPEKVAEKVTERIMNEYSIEGTVPLTAAGVEKIVQSACTAMKDEIVSLLKQSGPCNTEAGNAHPNLSEQTQQTNEYTSFYWCNPRDKKNQRQPVRHPIPQGFKIPKVNACDCWMLWNFGKVTMTDGVKIAIAPYSCIRSLDLAVKSEVTQLSKLRAVMNAVVEKATQKKIIGSERCIRQLSEQEARNVFDRAFSELLQDWYDESSGVAQNYMRGDQSIVTLYNLKQQYEKRNLSLI